MTKEYVIANLLNRYEQYGATEELIEKIITKVEGKLTYEDMHLASRVYFSQMYKSDDKFSPNELAKAEGVSVEEVLNQAGITMQLSEEVLDEKFLGYAQKTLSTEIKKGTIKLVCELYKKYLKN